MYRQLEEFTNNKAQTESGLEFKNIELRTELAEKTNTLNQLQAQMQVLKTETQNDKKIIEELK